MKFVALVSGGKDSIYSIHLATLEQHHELIACIHLGAPESITTTTDEPNDDDEEPEESYMYQSAGSNMVKYQIEQCLNVPCIVYPRKGRSVQTGLLYCTTTTTNTDGSRTENAIDDENNNVVEDEVEDLYHALVLAKQLFPMIEAVSSGAILSNYQRNRIEYIVCHTLQLHSLSYLWRKSNPQQLLQEMIHEGQISAILIKTASPPGLRPKTHLNRTIQELFPYFLQLQTKYQFQICGEGGEYESFVLYAKVFHNRCFVIDEWTIQTDTEEMVGTLQITQYHTEEYCHSSTTTTNLELSNTTTSTAPDTLSTTPLTQTNVDFHVSQNQQQRRRWCHPTLQQPSQNYHPPELHSPPPHLTIPVRQVNGGLYSISELTCPQPQPEDHTIDNCAPSIIIENEIRDILQLLQSLLDQIHCTAQDILMVHVYVANISYFQILNEQYRSFFGIVLPPSRSTVDVGTICTVPISQTKTQPAHIMIDCFVQCGSGTFMREHNYSTSTTSSARALNEGIANSTQLASVNAKYAHAAMQNTFTKLRDVLHVQSRSYWAPVCVGPYSQANTLRGCIHFCAGQIGLYPPTMQFQTNIWTDQLLQAWKNVANVLDALDACCIPKNLLSCILFISDSVFHFSNDGDDSDQVSEWTQLCDICTSQMACNGYVIPGDIDGIMVDPNKVQDDDPDEYEDEETRIEVEKNRVQAVAINESDMDEVELCPVLVVSIPKMPVGALCEIEVVAASRRATNALSIQDYVHTNIATSSVAETSTGRRYKLGWNAGHDFLPTNELPPEISMDILANSLSSPQEQSNDSTITINISSTEIQIRSYFRCLGSRATSCALITANITCDSTTTFVEQQHAVDLHTVLHSMIMALKAESHYDSENILHIRLYYINTSIDGMSVRHIFKSMMQESFRTYDTIPAATVIPVTDMGIIQPLNISNNNSKSNNNALTTNAMNPFLALQALSIDPIRTEQSVWIHEGRQEK